MVAVEVIPGRLSQFRDCGRGWPSGMGLRTGATEEVAGAASVDNVGTALADLLEKWPGRRGGRCGCVVSLSVDRDGSRADATVAVAKGDQDIVVCKDVGLIL